MFFQLFSWSCLYIIFSVPSPSPPIDSVRAIMSIVYDGVVHSDAYTCEQFLKLHVGLGLDFVFVFLFRFIIYMF